MRRPSIPRTVRSPRSCSPPARARGSSPRRPKVLHEVCGRPMLGHSVAAAESLAARAAGRRGRSRGRRGAQPLRGARRVRGPGGAARHRPRGALLPRGARGLPRRRAGALRRHAAAARRDARAHAPGAPRAGRRPGAALGAGRRAGHRRCATRRAAWRASSRCPTRPPSSCAIRERNTGVYLLDAELCWKLLARVGDDNAQGEVYLTDIVELAVRDGLRVEAVQLAGPEEALGVNTRAELGPRHGADAAAHREPLDRSGCHYRRSGGHLHRRGRRDRTRHADRARLRDPGHDPHRSARAPEGPLHDRVEPDRRRRRDGPLRAPAPELRDRRRLAHRQLRRGEEQRARPRREGRPPLLHRRRRRRRARQLRLRLGRRELRRPGQAPHDGRRARLHRLQRESGRAARDRGGQLRGGRLDDHDARAGRGARGGARAPAQHRGLGRSPRQSAANRRPRSASHVRHRRLRRDASHARSR